MKGELHIIPFSDTLIAKDSGVEREGKGSACRKFTRFLSSGTPELGRPRDWDRKTILVMDNLSSYAECAKRLSLEENGGITREGAHIPGINAEVEDMLSLLCDRRLQCHVMLIVHLMLIAPKTESLYLEKDAKKAKMQDLQLQIKQEIAALQETAFFPNMPGVKFASNIAYRFNTSLLFETTEKGRIIHTQPIQGYTIKMPFPGVSKTLPVETGLATILEKFEQSGERMKLMAQGYPGSGKTGCLAAAIDAGYRVVLGDFDDNAGVIKTFAKGE